MEILRLEAYHTLGGVFVGDAEEMGCWDLVIDMVYPSTLGTMEDQPTEL